jgi:hypothetical protein
MGEMKRLIRWLMVSASVAIALSTAPNAFGQSITVSPSSEPIQVNGTSGGGRNDSCAGHISAAPNHIVQVTEDADLRFVLQGQGEPTLLIRTASGKNFCVPADKYSNGKVEIPGRWQKGTYSIFIGDRANGQHPYTLMISRS